MDNDQLEFNDNVPGMLPIFVGRAIEITRLNHILQEVKNYKQPRFVLIQGDFGIGKTSLVENFIKEVIDKDSSILFGRGNCSMETELNGLTPFIQLLAGLGETAIKKRVIKDNLVNFVKETAPAWLDVVSGGIFSAVIKTVEVGGKVLGFKRNQSNIQETKFIQLQTAFETIAKNNVVVAFIDDIHWADATSLDLLFYLSRNLSNVSIMIICTYRPVEAMQTGRNARLFSQIRSELIRYNALEIILDQGIDVAEYLRKRFPFNNFPKSAVDNLQQITDGHALFVSQLVSLWVETGIIHSQKTRRGNQLWSINSKAFSYLAVPTSLSQVLDERLQRIQEELRNVLVCASVEGDNFTVQVIEQLCRLDERKTSDDLETLERRYLLLKELEPRLEDERLLNFYKFIHRFIRRHIYHQISDGKRRRLHKEVGDCLEVLHKDQRKISGQLTLHYKEAMEYRKALHYALIASQWEEENYSWYESKRWSELGLEMLKVLPTDFEIERLQMSLYLQLGNYYYYKSDYDHLKNTMELILCMEVNHKQEKAKAHSLLSELYLQLGNYPKALDHAQEMLKLAESLGIPHILALSLDQLSWVLLYLGEIQSALDAAKKAYDLYLEVNDREGLVYSNRVFGYVYEMLGRFEESLQARKLGLKIAEENKDEFNKGWLLFEIGELYQTLEDWDQARYYHEKHFQMIKEINEEGYLSYAYDGLGRVEAAVGNFDLGLEYLLKAMEIREKNDEKPWMAVTLCHMSAVNLTLGRRDLALQQAERAVDVFETIEERLFRPLGFFSLGNSLFALEQQQAALVAFYYAKEISSRIHTKVWFAQSAEKIAQLELARGNKLQAWINYQDALDTWQEINWQENTNRVIEQMAAINIK